VSKRDLILETTLVLVNEIGLLGTTVSQISKRANISPGIIYHYFSTKEEIIHTLYKVVEEEFVKEATRNNPVDLPILECYQEIWTRVFSYCVENPEKMTYIEAYQNSAYFKDCISTARNELLETLSKKNEASITAGELKDLPIEAIYAMTGRVALELAKLHIRGVNPLRSHSVEEMAESVCRSILAWEVT